MAAMTDQMSFLLQPLTENDEEIWFSNSLPRSLDLKALTIHSNPPSLPSGATQVIAYSFLPLPGHIVKAYMSIITGSGGLPPHLFALFII